MKFLTLFLIENNFWIIFPSIIAVITLFSMFIIYYLQKVEKKLSFYVNYNYPLINIKNDVKNDFEIKYKGEIIQDLSICEIVIENNGKEISSGDFEEPIKFIFSNCNFIYSVELVDCHPENLITKIDVDNANSQIKLNPLLMNNKDFLKFKIVYEGKNSEIKAQSRIKGLKSISFADKRVNKILLIFAYIIAPFLIITMFSYAAFFKGESYLFLPLLLFALVVFLSNYIKLLLKHYKNIIKLIKVRFICLK